MSQAAIQPRSWDTTPPADPNESAVLRLHPAPRLPAPAEGPTAGGSRVLGYLKYRWVMLLFLGSLVAAPGAYAAWKLIPAKYSTYSLLRVSSSESQVGGFNPDGPGSRNDFTTYLKTQAQLLRSHFVLNAALRDPAVANLPMLREQVDPVRFLEEELKVEYQEGSELIKVGLSGENPSEIAAIVNAIQKAYLKEIIDEEMLRKKERLRILEDRCQTMQSEVEKRYKDLKLSDDAEKPMPETPVALNNQLAAGQLVRLKDNLLKVQAEINTLRARCESLQSRINNPPAELPPGVSAADLADHDPRVAEKTKKVESLQGKLAYAIKLAGGQERPAVTAARQALEAARAERDKLRQDRIAEAIKSHQQPQVQRWTQDLEEAKVALNNALELKKATEEAITQYQDSITTTSADAETPDFIRQDIMRRKEIITRIMDKTLLLRLEVQAPARVQPLAGAGVPVKREIKKQILGSLVAGLLGFGLVGLCVLGYESRVMRVLSLGDVRRLAAGPVLGVVPGVAAAAAGGSDRSKKPLLNLGAVNEAVEKSRTLVLQQFARPGCKTVLVTGATGDEGQAFLAFQLAVSLAKTGTRTLLIDFDLRTPALHGFLNVPNERGVCEVLTAEADLHTAVVSFPNGLNLLPAGKWCDAVRQELTAERVGPMFARLREGFDCIVVHGHGVLSVADTYLAARFADMALLAVQKHASRLPLVARAQDKLAGLAPEAFGVVFLGASDEECLY